MFLTTVALKISEGGRSFRYASAGHNPFMLYRSTQDEFMKGL